MFIVLPAVEIPKDSIAKYETALQDGRNLPIGDGTARRRIQGKVHHREYAHCT
jgi:hypothetical protein